MTIENEELDEAELFNAAISDEPEVIPEAPEPVIEPEKPVAEVVAEPELTAEKPAVDDSAPQVPSWRVREINEEKRAAIAERDALLAERANWQRQQTTEQPKPAEKPAKPDPLLDPEGYEAYLEAKVEAKFLNDRRETSLQAARDANPKEFDEAYAAAQKAVDPALKARMQETRNPGKTLLEWHREEKAKAEVGTDLTAYKAKLREEALKDPEFRKAAMEAWRADAQPSNNSRPRVDLPPSLNGASRSNAALRSSQEDVSDAELFSETTG
jgi:hypothetical protein